MLTYKELLEKFLFFENEYKLFNYRINNIPVWELIRYHVFIELRKKYEEKKIEVDNKTGKKLLLAIFNLLKYYFVRNPFKLNREIDLLILSHPRRKLLAGTYNDIYTDPFITHLKSKYIVLESFFELNHLTPVKTANMYYLDTIELPKRILERLPFRPLISTLDREKITEIEESIQNYWDIHETKFNKLIIRVIKQYDYMYPKLEKLISKLKPKKIINVISYSFYIQIITQIARRKGIPVYELQHGTVGKYHIAYNYPKDSIVEMFPDFFLAWGNNWIKNARMPISNKHKIIVGFPYINEYRIFEETRRNQKQVVFISQLRLDIAHFANKLAKEMPDYKIIFKAHPSEYSIAKNKYSFLLINNNIEIIDSDKVLLYDLFKQSGFIFGVNSTSILEALAFGPRISIIKLPGWEYYEDLEEDSCVRFISNIEEAISFLSTLSCLTTPNDVSNYFESDSINKIFETVDI